MGERMKCYLAGHMTRPGESDWRRYIISRINEKENNIIFLIPIDHDLKDLPDITRNSALATGDKMFLNQCDCAILNLDLKLGSCLGAVWEFGYLCRRNIPVILINHQPDLGKTKFLEHNASVVVYNANDAVDILRHMEG
jgi:nucleoside 2-deoxyribosyltransferase